MLYRKRHRLMPVSALLAAGICPPVLAQQLAADDAAETLQEVIVTGSRGQPRTVTSSPTPIDVIGGEQLGRLGGALQLRDVLTQLVPSFQAQSVGSSSFDSVARSAGLRGLSGVHVLVLVNGKRRHNSSLINLNSGNVSAGANPVDLDLIPTSAIERIEILRDGAAAQYGSDAIAGVINVILKSNDSGGSSSIESGQRYGHDGSGSDGETVQAQISHGFALPGGGSTTLSMDAKSVQPVVRNSDVTGTLYFPIAPGVPDPREATADRRTYKGGLPKVKSINLAQNTLIPVGEARIYTNGTLGFREAEVGQAGRRPNSTSNIIEIYPDGFTPYYTLEEYDFQLTGGVTTTMAEWDMDLSTTFGRNHTENGSKDSLNASLGTASPTKFDTFSSQFDQWTTNLDLTRPLEVFGGRRLQVSTGAEHRYESYETNALDEAAYANGGYFYPSGTPLAGQPGVVGAQGAIVVNPSDEASIERHSAAAYVDFALDVSPKWLVALAGRYEYYDDSAGNVFGGKLSSRYELTDWLAVRGAVSNGFRAPSLAQQGFAQTSTQFNLVGGVYNLIESKIVQTGSPIAQALGAPPLDPEESRNYSLGFTFTPMSTLTVTVDAYQIDLDDRITLTGLLSNAGVRAILVANGFSGNQFVRFFTNAIDTRTRGVDVVGSYTYDAGRAGRFRGTVGFNHNQTEITRIAPTPAALSGLGLTLFDRQTQGYFTVGTPEDKLILGLDWSLGALSINLKETRYGSFQLLNNNPAFDQSYGPKWITDLEASYSFDDRFSVALGAYNLFDVYPDKNTVANTIGNSPYAANSPFGGYGGLLLRPAEREFLTHGRVVVAPRHHRPMWSPKVVQMSRCVRACRMQRRILLTSLLTATSAMSDTVPEPVFTSVQPEMFGSAGALSNAWADYDGDGDLDLIVSYEGGELRLFRNDRGVFAVADTHVGLPPHVPVTRSLAWGDFDGDGDPDLHLGTAATPIPAHNLLFRNDGAGGFVEVAAELGVSLPGASSRQSNWIDYDNDGDLDLFVAQRAGGNRLFRNEGGTFIDVSRASGLYDLRRSVAACWFDFDKDGDLDVYVGNQNGDREGFYRNESGVFTDIARSLGIDQGERAYEDGAAGCAVADFDNDGELDLFVAAYGPNILYRNEGGRFVDVARRVGLILNEHQVGASWGDFDLDGRIDLYVAGFRGGQPRQADHLYRNTPAGFVDVLPQNIARSDADHGVQWADYDGDGDLDLALANSDKTAGGSPLFRNDLHRTKDMQSLAVKVLDANDRATQAGAEIRLYNASGRLLATRLVETGSGYGAQNAMPVHFGIAERGRVDVEVTFMSNHAREVQRIGGVDPKRFAGTALIIRRTVARSP